MKRLLFILCFIPVMCNAQLGGLSGGVTLPSVVSVATTTYDPSNKGSNITLSSGNLTYSISPATSSFVRGTVGYAVGGTGIHQVEITQITGGGNGEPCGIVNSAVTNYNQEPAAGLGAGMNYVYYNGGNIYSNNSAVQTVATYGALDKVGYTFNAVSGALRFYKNGVQVGTPITVSSSGTWYPMSGGYSGGTCSGSVVFLYASMTYPISGATNW